MQNSYQTIFISVGLLLILHLLGKPVGKLLSRDETEKSVLEYSVTISNYAYMGYTLAEGIWGSRMLTDLVLFCIPFAMYTYTVGYMKLTGSKKNLKRLFNPMTVAIALGMIWGLCGIPVPAVLRTAAQSASACVGPLSMLLTGFVLSTFSFSSLWGSPRDYVMVVLRLVVLPAFVWGLFWLCGLKSFSTPALLMASMPTGLNTIIFTKNAGRSPALGARLAFLSGILSIVTLPLWLSILQ